MKKHILVIAALILAPAILPAQDVLVKKNKEILQVKVEQVTSSEINYRLFDFQSGPVFVIPIREIESLTYSNGKQETFGNSTRSASEQPNGIEKSTSKNVLPFEPNRNIVGFNAVGIIISQIHVSYKRIFEGGFLSVNVPVVAAFDRQALGINQRNLLWAAGCEFLYYPTGQRAASYFLGFGQELGQVEQKRAYQIYEPHPTMYGQIKYVGTQEEYVASNSYGVYFANGLEIIPFKWFSFQVGFILGVRRVYLDKSYYDGQYNVSTGSSIDPLFRGEIKLNFRF